MWQRNVLVVNRLGILLLLKQHVNNLHKKESIDSVAMNKSAAKTYLIIYNGYIMI